MTEITEEVIAKVLDIFDKHCLTINYGRGVNPEYSLKGECNGRFNREVLEEDVPAVMVELERKGEVVKLIEQLQSKRDEAKQIKSDITSIEKQLNKLKGN